MTSSLGERSFLFCYFWPDLTIVTIVINSHISRVMLALLVTFPFINHITIFHLRMNSITIRTMKINGTIYFLGTMIVNWVTCVIPRF